MKGYYLERENNYVPAIRLIQQIVERKRNGTPTADIQTYHNYKAVTNIYSTLPTLFWYQSCSNGCIINQIVENDRCNTRDYQLNGN